MFEYCLKHGRAERAVEEEEARISNITAFYLSVWCSWVTWYWVAVSLSRSSDLSNSFLGLMDFLMSGMTRRERRTDWESESVYCLSC